MAAGARPCLRGAAAGLVLVTGICAASAEDMPVFRLEFDDGAIAPLRLSVPAGRRFKIELHNVGATPVEFESHDLHKEKVLAPESSSFIVIRRLAAGEYVFFDDFHLDAPRAVLISE